MKDKRFLWCCGCNAEVPVRLTDGKEIYPHRKDLYSLPFWKCDNCKNFVGCHHKTKERTKPLGCIPTKELKNARQHIHRILDPIWKSKRMKRSTLYRQIADEMGIAEYHTAEIKTIEDARKVWTIVAKIAQDGTTVLR